MALYSDPTITGVAPESENQHKGNYFGYLAVAVSVLIAAVFLVQTLLNKNENKSLQDKIAKEQATVDSYSGIKDQLSFYDSAVKDFTSIFSRQIQWGALLNDLSSRLYKGVKITSLQLNADGTATLTGKLKNYSEYSKFYNTMTDASSSIYFSDVKVGSVTRASDLDLKKGAESGAKTTTPVNTEEVIFTYNLKLSPLLLSADDYDYKINYLSALIAKDVAAMSDSSLSQAVKQTLSERIGGMKTEQARLSVESSKRELEKLKAKTIALESENTKLVAELYQDSYSASKISQNTEAIRVISAQITTLQSKIEAESNNLK